MAAYQKRDIPTADSQPNRPDGGVPVNALPMRWHKAFSNVIIWLSILLNFSNGIRHLIGYIYVEKGSDISYEIFPSLSPLDKCYGAAGLGVAVLLFFAWLGLRRFKRGVWVYPTVIYAVNAVLSLIYLVVFISITHAGITDRALAPVTARIFTSVVLGAVNFAYYKKRSSLFVN